MNSNNQDPPSQAKRRKRKPKQGGVGGQSHLRSKSEYPPLQTQPTQKLSLSALHYASHIGNLMLPTGHHPVFNDQLHNLIHEAKKTQKAIEMLEAHVKYDHRKEAVAELEAHLSLITMTIDGLRTITEKAENDSNT